MIVEGKLRHFFPAGNTTEGFFSFFDNIIKRETANHLYCIKGGPGTGKSSLMKKIGKHFLELGYEVEFHHCSSDPESLDAVVISDLKVALLDGTAPHVVDPKFPGAVDEIVNLGENWDEVKMKENKSEIIRLTKENSRLFQKAYGYLHASGNLYSVYENTAFNVFSKEKINMISQSLIKKIFQNTKITNNIGEQRNLFAFGITPLGIIDYRNDFIKAFTNKIIIKEDLFSTSEELMNQLKNEAMSRGINVICLHSPLKINKILDIIIDELDLIISVDNPFHKYSHECKYDIDLTNYVNEKQKEYIHDEVTEDVRWFNSLFNRSIDYIKKAKENHDILEQYYVESMDFSKHDILLESLIKKIESFK